MHVSTRAISNYSWNYFKFDAPVSILFTIYHLCVKEFLIESSTEFNGNEKHKFICNISIILKIIEVTIFLHIVKFNKYCFWWNLINLIKLFAQCISIVGILVLLELFKQTQRQQMALIIHHCKYIFVIYNTEGTRENLFEIFLSFEAVSV